MHVIIRQDQVVFDGQLNNINDLQTILDELLNQNQAFIGSLIIDGVEVYEDVNYYLENNFGEIQEIEITLISEMELTLQMINEGERYLFRALPEIERLADAFYKGANNTTWSKLNQLIEGIQWLLQLTNRTYQLSKTHSSALDYNNLSSVFSSLSMQIENIVHSIQNEDHVLLGDYLLYEIHPSLSTLHNILLNSVALGAVKNES